MNENNEEVKRHIIKFMEWLTDKNNPFVILYGEEKRFATNEGEFSIEEIYSVYKKYCNELASKNN